MTRDEYCIEVCGGACCYLEGVSCPHLKRGACSIYKERFKPGAPEFQLVGLVQIKKKDGIEKKPFFCWQIEKLLQTPSFPAEIKKGCVYAHPELLEKYNGTKTTDQKLAS